MIYKYQKISDAYTDYTLVGENVVELATINGWSYVMIPDNATLPTQPRHVQDTLALADDLTAEQITAIKAACPGIAHQLTKINQDVNAYILSHYDAGTQNSFNGLYAKRSTPDALRDLLDPVWTWIESVMMYYYAKKAEILETHDYSNVTWDFGQFDATKPSIALSGIIAALAA